MFRHRHAKGKLLSYMQITRWSDKTKRKFNQVSIFISFNLTWKWLNLLEIYCKKFWSKFELESRFYWRVDDVSQTTPFFTWTKKTLKKNKINWIVGVWPENPESTSWVCYFVLECMVNRETSAHKGLCRVAVCVVRESPKMDHGSLVGAATCQ